MKAGKISNTVLDRSIVKIVNKKANSVLCERPGAGHDNSAWSCEENQDVLVVTGMGYGINGVYTAVNNLAVSGVKAKTVHIGIVMPEKMREIALKRIMSRLNEDCMYLDVEIAGGHTQVSADVVKPVIVVTATGTCRKGERLTAKSAKAGQDIVMTKCIGIGGAQAIIDEKRDELIDYFNELTVERAYGSREELSVAGEAKAAIGAGVLAMHDCSQGGIYAALWDLAESAHMGIDIDFRAIAVRQEIVEVCERYDINPYELDSTGCLLMTSDDGCATIDILNTYGIDATVIGRLTKGNERIIRNREEVRYLEAPKQDELYTAWESKQDC